ncbi:MAG: hypothetical protein KDA87_21020 [Planctomycetales bacterium]|nr:hypothetical protein [Planctomycetales bacterium]
MPRLKTWIPERVRWYEVGRLFQPAPLCSEIRLTAAEHQFVIFWFFWDRNRRRKSFDFCEQFEISRSSDYSKSDMEFIAYSFFKEQVLFAICEVREDFLKDCFEASTEFHKGGSLENNAWAIQRFEDCFCELRNAESLIESWLHLGLAKLISEFPHLEQFLRRLA